MSEHGVNVPEGATDLDLYRENLRDETEGLATRLADLQVGAARLPETIDDTNEGDVTDFAAQISAALKEVEKVRKSTKEPWLERSKLIDAHFKQMADPVRKVLDRVRARLAEYRREKERLERERQEQARREAEEAERKAREEAEQKRLEAERMAKEATQ